MKRSVYMLLAGMVLGSTGCSTVIKQGYYGVTGAKGQFYELEAVKPTVLATYKSFRVEPFTNTLGEHVPQEVIAEVNQLTPKILDASCLFYPEGKRLRLKGQIVHYTGKSGLKGSAMSIIGSSDDCACRVQLLDDESGEMIGEAVCWGSVKSAVRRGAEEVGSGVGKGVTTWFEKRLPKEVVEVRREQIQATREAQAEE